MGVRVSWLRWFGIVLTIIGFGGFPDAIRGWMGWLAMVEPYIEYVFRGVIVIAGIAAFTYPKWLHYLVPARHRATPATPPVVVPAPAERQAWEIPGARRDEYPIYEAACLLANEPVTWPLSPRAQGEYEAIMVWRPPVTVHGSPDTQRAAVVEWAQLNPDLRFNRITKEELRRYLRAASRPLPAFLDKRFDW